MVSTSRIERAAAMLLTLAAGFADALGYLAAGIFPANMTGNTVLVGILLGQGHWAAALDRAGALGAFFVGSMLGYTLRRISRGETALAVEATLLAVVAVAPLPTSLAIHGVAFAMGIQAAAVLSFGGIALSTVVVTSTMARIAERTVQRAWPDRPPSPPGPSSIPPTPSRSGRLLAVTWLGYAVGAAAGTVVRLEDHALLGPAALVFLAAIVLVTARRSTSPPKGSSP